MKAINTFLLLMLIYSISAAAKNFDTQICEEHGPSAHNSAFANKQGYSLDFCRTTKINDPQYVRCCFIKWKDNQDRRQYNCFPIKNKELSDIDETIDGLEGKSTISKVVSLDCDASYLYGTFLIILAFLF